jgi:hypothetical protein
MNGTWGYVVIGGGLLVAAVAVVGSWARNLRTDHRLTQPMGAIAGLYGTFLVLYVVLAAYSLYHGFGGGGTQPGSVCVTTAFGSSGAAGPGQTARAGAAIRAVGHTQACALHPGLLQWVLFLLTKLPSLVLWGWVLLLVWRLIRQADRGGPFTAPAAATMRQLGWLIIAGSMVAAALGALGTDVLARMLMTPAPFDGRGIAVDVLVAAPLKALLPVPLLAGATLLSFARIIRAGAVLDEEVKATV